MSIRLPPSVALLMLGRAPYVSATRETVPLPLTERPFEPDLVPPRLSPPPPPPTSALPSSPLSWAHWPAGAIVARTRITTSISGRGSTYVRPSPPLPRDRDIHGAYRPGVFAPSPCSPPPSAPAHRAQGAERQAVQRLPQRASGHNKPGRPDRGAQHSPRHLPVHARCAASPRTRPRGDCAPARASHAGRGSFHGRGSARESSSLTCHPVAA